MAQMGTVFILLIVSLQYHGITGQTTAFDVYPADHLSPDDQVDPSNIRYTKRLDHKPNFQQRPSDQRIYDKSLSLPGEASKPAIPDPLEMPYPDVTRFKPYEHPKLRFKPPFLDFTHVTIGSEETKTVTIYNLDQNQPITINKFKSPDSLFTPRGPTQTEADGPITIQPGSNETFDIIFVPRSVGNVEQTIFLVCDDKKYSYQVMGEGVESPFRIRPFIGAKIPRDSNYKTVLKLHNPEPEPMQIIQWYASTSRLQLEPIGNWLIEPFEDKIIGDMSFLGKDTTGLQEAYVRLKYRHGEKGESAENEKNLLIPVQVEFKEDVGIYSVEPELDFGIVRTHDEKRTLSLNIINSGESARDAQIDWIRQMEQPKESFLKLHFQPIKVPPFSKQYPRPHNIANLTFTFDQKQVEKHGVRDFSGTIKVHVKNMALPVKYNALEIPWKAKMLDGHLDIADADRRFILSEMREDGITSREVRVHNTLSVPIILYKIEIQDNSEGHFSIEDFDEPVVIQPFPAAKSTLFRLKFNSCSYEDVNGIKSLKCPEDINVESTMVLHTNASHFSYQLSYLSGRLKYQTMHDKILDFGLVSSEETKCTQMMIQNFNPMDIMLSKSSTMDSLSVYVLSAFKISEVPQMKRGYNFTSFEHKRPRDGWPRDGWPVKLLKNSTMFFECCVTKGRLLNGEFKEHLNFITKHQLLKVPVQGRFAKGELRVMSSPIKLDKNGNPITANLTVRSTFSQIFEVADVISESPRDIYFTPFPNVKIKPNANVTVGQLSYNSSNSCPPTTFGCVGSLRMETTKEGEDWHKKNSSPPTLAKNDAEYYSQFRKKFESDIKRSLLMITSMKSTVEFEVEAKLNWPRLIQSSNDFEHNFLPTVVANIPGIGHVTGQATVTVRNPTNDWLLIQPILLTDLTSSSDIKKIVDSLRPQYPWIKRDLREYHRNFMIGMPGGTRVQDGRWQQMNRWILSPGQQAPIHLGFGPEGAKEHENVLLLRNNLTVLEPLRLIGRGIKEDLKFPEESHEVTITLNEKELKDCYNPGHVPFKDGKSVRVKIQNNVLIASTVVNITINGYPCRGGGWEVMDCMNGRNIPPIIIPAATKPNINGVGTERVGEKEIKLRYRPDFSVLHTRAEMVLHTQHGAAFTFSLRAEVKETDIVACRKSIPRPTWEAPIRRVILIMMVVLLIGILLMGFIEANYIIEPWLLSRKAISSELSESGFQHLRKMYVDYFKFVDSKAQTKSNNIKRLVGSGNLHHEDTVQRIVQNRQKSIDRESNVSRATTKSTSSQKSKKSRNQNLDLPKSKTPSRQPSVVSSLDGTRNGWSNDLHINETESKENGSLIGSSVSESETSSNDFRAIDDILPNEHFEDEELEETPEWVDEPVEEGGGDFREFREPEISDSDSEHNLLTPPQSESPLPYHLGGDDLFPSYNRPIGSVYPTDITPPPPTTEPTREPTQNTHRSKYGMDNLIHNVKSGIAFNPAPGRPNRSPTHQNYYTNSQLYRSMQSNHDRSRMYPYRSDYRDSPFDREYTYDSYRSNGSPNDSVYSNRFESDRTGYSDNRPYDHQGLRVSELRHRNPPPGFSQSQTTSQSAFNSTGRQSESENWKDLFLTEDQRRKRQEEVCNKGYDKTIKNIWRDSKEE